MQSGGYVLIALSGLNAKICPLYWDKLLNYVFYNQQQLLKRGVVLHEFMPITRAGHFSSFTGELSNVAKVNLKRPSIKPKRPSIKRLAADRAKKGTLIDRAHRFLFNRRDESSYFEPHSLGFWRNLIMYLFLFSMVGHAMEVPYCAVMGSLFGIIENDYAAIVDPWYVPYWVYGFGALALSLIMVPLKIKILDRCRTLWGACILFFISAVALCAILETAMGLMVNQPDQFGEYPFWDNSKLPLNILQQGWIVNDIFLGFVSVFFVWVVFPLCQKCMKIIGEKWANRVFIGVASCCALCCFFAYAWPAILKLLA